MSAVSVVQGTQAAVVSEAVGEVVIAGSPLYQEALQLQAGRFAPTVKLGPAAGEAYLQVTDYSPDSAVPIVVRSAAPLANNQGFYAPGTLLCAARLELAGATFIESCMVFAEGSPTAAALASGRVAEIGGFATPVDLEKANMPDVLDTLAAIILRVAEEQHLEWFWLFPRSGFMSVIQAEIPEILPPYRFTYCHDVVAWNTTNERFQQFLSLRPRGLQRYPELYQIHRSTLEEDLALRLSLRPKRRERRRDEMNELLFGAMRQAHRNLVREIASMHAAASPASMGPALQPDASGLTDTQPAQPMQSSAVAFTGSSEIDAAYLQAVMQEGGSAAAAYKEMSFRLLRLEAGMNVLDVGCGVGVDLPTLGNLVGRRGHVVGLERDAKLVSDARKDMDSRRATNVTVLQGDAEHMTFPDAYFDRVRADRAVQHFDNPSGTLAEMRRVLRPGGVLTLVEPDWKTMTLYPASSRGGNDDSALMRLLEWHQRDLPQALIGRRLHGLLRGLGDTAWSQVEVQVHTFSLTSWPMVDTVLEITKATKILAAEEPALADELDAWLRAVERAADTGAFFAALPLFFAYAQRTA